MFQAIGNLGYIVRQMRGFGGRTVTLGAGFVPAERFELPREADFSGIAQNSLDAIALRLNQRPRKTLDFETPADKIRRVFRTPFAARRT